MKKIIFVASIAFVVSTSISCTKKCECKNEKGEVIYSRMAGGFSKAQKCSDYNEAGMICTEK
jgi:hypothetical protein